ncbi:hypothetical protein OPV22_002122 [Ensete ventricosum]|uniref:Uncharacterized protein n=1 Tax=Ensete ventricosum TaxID=4639 RepID=A0AAV8RX16_ENSVE|nr:hypothetical protein OPV22_002122 [Ensete ventricosum]
MLKWKFGYCSSECYIANSRRECDASLVAFCRHQAYGQVHQQAISKLSCLCVSETSPAKLEPPTTDWSMQSRR